AHLCALNGPGPSRRVSKGRTRVPLRSEEFRSRQSFQHRRLSGLTSVSVLRKGFARCIEKHFSTVVAPEQINHHTIQRRATVGSGSGSFAHGVHYRVLNLYIYIHAVVDGGMVNNVGYTEIAIGSD